MIGIIPVAYGYDVINLPESLAFDEALGLYSGTDITGGFVYDFNDEMYVEINQQQAKDFYYGCKTMMLIRTVTPNPFSGKVVVLQDADGKEYSFCLETGVQTGTYGSSYICYGPKEGNETLFSLYDVYEDSAAKKSVQWAPKISTTDHLTMPEAAWARDYVKKATDYGFLPYSLTKKYSSNISREEFCILLGQLLCVEYNYKSLSDYMADNQLIYLKNTFSDCINSDDSIPILHELGIVNGVGGDLFQPGGTLSREQAAKMLAETAKRFVSVNLNGSPKFDDNKFISQWAKPYVAWAHSTGIMSGLDAKNFGPLEYYTVEQAIATVVRLHEQIQK